MVEYTPVYEEAFRLVVGHEGGYTANPNDSGNWTGGSVGQGMLKGTKYGISAASYPNHDIANLQLHDAHLLYHRDYWTKAGCDHWQPPLAFIVFDAAVNNGVGRAVKWLQAAAGLSGAAVDGAVGPQTRGAVIPKDQTALAWEVHAQRIFFMAGLSTWATFGLGWSRRLARLPAEAVGMAAL